MDKNTQMIDDKWFQIAEEVKKPTQIVKLKHNEKVIGKVGLQFGNSLRTGAETFVIKTQSVDI